MQLPIGQNLYEALVYLSPGTKPTGKCSSAICSCGSFLGPELWVDAICINQRDKAEKESLVAKMGLIYSQSDVWAWLGGSVDNSDVATNAINAIKQDIDNASYAGGSSDTNMPMPDKLAAISAYLSRRLFHNGSATPELRALQAFFARPYWTRVWIMQEAILGLRVIFFCGTSIVKRDDVCVVYYYILILFSGLRPWKTRTGENIETISTNPALTLGCFGHTPNARLTFKQVLITCHIAADGGNIDRTKRLGKFATKPKDYIFGMAGLVGDDLAELGTQVDYGKPIQELFTEVACAHIERRQDAFFLELCQFPKTTPNLPSWVPDWAMGLQTSLRELGEEGQFKAAGDSKFLVHITKESWTLHTLGYRIGAVARVGKDLNPIVDGSDGDDKVGMGRWLWKVLKLLNSHPTPLPYKGAEAIEDAVWRTLIADSQERTFDVSYQGALLFSENIVMLVE